VELSLSRTAPAGFLACTTGAAFASVSANAFELPPTDTTAVAPTRTHVEFSMSRLSLENFDFTETTPRLDE
jgi:hypothetical protein